MKKLLVAPALAALAVFLFGAIYWMSPLPYSALSRVADDAATGEALGKLFPTTGAYFVPGMYLDPVQHEALVKRGPIAEVHFRREGRDLFQPGVMLKGYMHSFVVCLLLALLLECVGPSIGTVWSRTRLCLMAGLLVALWQYSDVIWWHHSLAWETFRAVYAVLAFGIAGLVLGKLLTPKHMPAPAQKAQVLQTTG